MVKVIDESWDILIVLDTCRYDIFKEIYKEFVKGKLKKEISVGHNTITWFKNTFDGHKYPDIIYISGNPYINSRYVNNFYKVVDVWDFGYDKILRTIHPHEMNKAFLKYFLKYPNKRFIIHYIQPHYPYISVSPEYIRIQKNQFIYLIAQNNKKIILNKIISIIPHNIKWNVMKYLANIGFNIQLGVGQIYLDNGWEGVRNAYIGDLKFVLKYISKLLNHIKNKKVIITADHGEMLGEKGFFGHPAWNSKERLLREIPWFEVIDENG